MYMVFPIVERVKKAIQWLEENNVTYQFINTKENPPQEKMIKEWVNTLGVKSMRNTSGMSYRALGEEKTLGQKQIGLRHLPKMLCY